MLHSKALVGGLFLLATIGDVDASPTKRWPSPLPALTLNKYDKEIFDVAMQLGDWSWEPSTGYIQANDDGGHTSTRFTAWYVPGLLYRNGNEGDDVNNAIWAIKNLISLQFTDPAYNNTPWYWNFKLASDIPDPNNVTFTPSIYGSYDPNWAFFIGTQFVQIIEEFEHLLPADLVDDMVDSVYKAARNLMTRVGYDGDNLVTAYSNPAIGRALLVEWVGVRIGDQNLTDAGAQYARDIYTLFTADDYNTLGEYNVPTYYGTDVYGLCQWIRHAPSGSKLPEYGTYILKELWKDIGEHYNYKLKNMVGPYDRVYHRNMLVDDSIISLFFWQLLGREVAPVAPIGQGSTLYDLRQGAAFALTGQTLRDTLDSSTIDMLTTYIGQGNQRLFEKDIRVSLDNDTTRVNTMWMIDDVMAGGQQINEEYNRGSQFTPLITHWKSGDTALPSRPFVSFFQLYATASTINATVTPYHISISYPNTTQEGSDRFQYLIGDIPAPYYASGRIMNGFENLPCLNVTITSQGLNGTIELSQYGEFTIQNNAMYQVVYYVEEGYEGVARMEFDLTYTC